MVEYWFGGKSDGRSMNNQESISRALGERENKLRATVAMQWALWVHTR